MSKNNKNNEILALPCGDYEEPLVLSSFTLHSDYNRRVEAVGERIEYIISCKLNPHSHNALLGDEDEAEVIEEDKEEYFWEKEYRESKKGHGFSMEKVIKEKKKDKKEKKDKENEEEEVEDDDEEGNEKDNYYTLLGLEDQFVNATQEDIRKAYKKLAQKNHPDKIECVTEKDKKKANKRWLRFKDAYETLTDPDKKIKYDSSFKFDDTIPSKEEASKVLKEEKEFYRMFGPVFLKNSIWSTKKPVPKIGDMNTDFKKVKRFYNFWYSFSSWRDFEVEGEYNLDEAENRWEKRAMLKENKKLKAQMTKDEKSRIFELVELAYKHDPRIIAEEKKLEEEKERLRKERQETAIRLKKEKIENEERLKREYDERKKREAEELVLLKKNLEEKLFDVIKSNLGLTLTKDEIFTMKLNINVENMKTILKEIDEADSTEDKIRSFKTLGNKLLGLKFVDDKKESSIWTKEEIFNLQKAVKKFPAGTVNRWEKMYEIVKTKGTNQIITMTHFLATNPNMKFTGENVDLKVLLNKNKEKETKKEEDDNKNKEEDSKNKEEWSDNQQKALENALKKYPGSLPANERWTKIASEVPDKTKKQCVERFKFLSTKIKNKENK